jgi:hypothetical protein
VRHVEQDAPLVWNQKHLDGVIQPVFGQTVLLGDAPRSPPDISYRLKDRDHVFCGGARVEYQAHDRAAVETNLALHFHRAEFVVQLR